MAQECAQAMMPYKGIIAWSGAYRAGRSIPLSLGPIIERVPVALSGPWPCGAADFTTRRGRRRHRRSDAGSSAAVRPARCGKAISALGRATAPRNGGFHDPLGRRRQSSWPPGRPPPSGGASAERPFHHLPAWQAVKSLSDGRSKLRAAETVALSPPRSFWWYHQQLRAAETAKFPPLELPPEVWSVPPLELSAARTFERPPLELFTAPPTFVSVRVRGGAFRTVPASYQC